MRIAGARQIKKHHPAAGPVIDALSSAICAVEPEYLLRGSVSLHGRSLLVKDIAGVTHKTDFSGRIFVFAAGKAAPAMMTTLRDILRPYFQTGLLIAPRGTRIKATSNVQVLFGSHPVPDEDSQNAARNLIDFVQNIDQGDLVVAAISGGTSALVSLPPNDIPLSQKQALTRMLLRSGANINEINTVRKHLSEIKGGRLVKYLRPESPLVSLIISDVVGNDLGAIGSGLTVPDPTTFGEALDVLQKYRMRAPRQVASWLSKGAAGSVPESPKPGDPIFSRVKNIIVGDNTAACKAAIAKLSRLGIKTSYLGSTWTCNAKEFGFSLCRLASDLAAKAQLPVALVAGGETIVNLGERKGRGGRNQEAALSFAYKMHTGADIVAGFLGTDGIDGNSPAAGGLVSKETLRILRRGEIGRLLGSHESYRALDRAHSLIMTGPTGTNVSDIAVILIPGRKQRLSRKLQRVLSESSK